jgi:hypothetical protein
VSRLYLYALLGGPPPGPLGAGLAGEPLRLVRCGDLLAIAGDVPKAPSIDAASLRAHDATVRRLAEMVEAVLPIRFCTLVDDESALAGLLEPQRAGLGEALALVAGREQMTLRLYGERLLDEAAGPDTDTASGPGARYLAARLRERQRVHGSRELATLRRGLGTLIVDERVERHDMPPLLASLYHLIERGASARYLSALQTVAAELGAVRARATGPWPPYAFAPGAVP